MHGAQGVIESRVNGSWVDKGTLAKLLDSSEPLEARGVYHVEDETSGDLDKPMDRVVDNLGGLDSTFQYCS